MPAVWLSVLISAPNGGSSLPLNCQGAQSKERAAVEVEKRFETKKAGILDLECQNKLFHKSSSFISPNKVLTENLVAFHYF